MLNLALQDILNPSADKRLEISSGNRTIRYRDKVMQTKNMETVSNGDIGFVSVVDKEKLILFCTYPQSPFGNLADQRLYVFCEKASGPAVEVSTDD